MPRCTKSDVATRKGVTVARGAGCVMERGHAGRCAIREDAARMYAAGDYRPRNPGRGRVVRRGGPSPAAVSTPSPALALTGAPPAKGAPIPATAFLLIGNAVARQFLAGLKRAIEKVLAEGGTP